MLLMPGSSDPEREAIVEVLQAAFQDVLHARDLYTAAKRNLDEKNETYEAVSIKLYQYDKTIRGKT